MPHIDDRNDGRDFGADDDPIRWPDPSPLDLWWQRVMSESLRRARTQPVHPKSSLGRNKDLRPHAS
ncbi:hypothetical protein EP51_28310 [Rhodococcus opacus]|uniref:Uncharacterized protein n=1 Tax=Rhodococcus opacus TaxID=37919 RepID=A0A076ET42_RHOOP|nr:hypothetical protein EP51_28310 [Rhodococcus opacus]